MSDSWSTEMLTAVDDSPEIEISARHPDGRYLRFTPVWMVRHGDDVYVRTWYRRDTGWYGRAIQSRSARVRLGGMQTDVVVSDVGDIEGEIRSAVDAAYRTKYGRNGGSVGRMVGDEAAQTTLRLDLVDE
ncbi:DUF2255 family protein [Gordonia sp. LSe1-13]|uniref:DUF2255 family protein n=1 Tax=Gordonia sesuvii TaxID=3116777 RepID=A0ABU7MG55_9ACTN|nr:DUF2255 family protein [Gordonia sp. LSe1-13]